jgi:hypothetical protein
MVKLAHGWVAAFLDGPQRIVLTKPGRQQRMTLQWQAPFLKAIDPVSGVFAAGLTSMLPDDVRQPLIAAARERWGI